MSVDLTGPSDRSESAQAACYVPGQLALTLRRGTERHLAGLKDRLRRLATIGELRRLIGLVRCLPPRGWYSRPNGTGTR